MHAFGLWSLAWNLLSTSISVHTQTPSSCLYVLIYRHYYWHCCGVKFMAHSSETCLRLTLLSRFRSSAFSGQSNASSSCPLPVASLAWEMSGVFRTCVTRMAAEPFWSRTWSFSFLVESPFSCSRLAWVSLWHVAALRHGDWRPVSRASDGHHWWSFSGSTSTTLLSWRGTCFISSRNGRLVHIFLQCYTIAC